ncbi:MAG TPA: MOSC domain-containing protein [Thermoanaerobaculia bacterium]
MTTGRVISLHVAPAAAAPMTSVDSVRAVAGRGLEGDRYFLRTGTFSRTEADDHEITLIEMEAIEALVRDYGVPFEAQGARRNVATRGAALNHLVGQAFRVGAVTLQGLRLCEPCSHMEKVSGKPARAGLVHRGGLRARILTDGVIRVGDPVETL